MERRLREEFATLEVEVNEDKSASGGTYAKAESFGFVGFEFRRVRSRSGRWMPLYRPQTKNRTALLQRELKAVFRRSRSQPVTRVIEEINPDVARLGQLLCARPLRPVFLVHSKLGRAEGSASPGEGATASRLRLEAVEVGAGCMMRSGLFDNYRVRPRPKVAPAR